MITTNTGAKKLEASDNWREIFPNPTLSTAGAHNASVDAQDRIQAEVAPIINGKQCALGAASGDYVLLRNSTITGKSDGAYIATKAIPANTDIDSTYLGNAITGGISNSLNSKIATKLEGITLTPASGITISNQNIRRAGNVVMFTFDFSCSSTISTYDVVATLSKDPSLQTWYELTNGLYIPTGKTVYLDVYGAFRAAQEGIPAGTYALHGMFVCPD